MMDDIIHVSIHLFLTRKIRHFAGDDLYYLLKKPVRVAFTYYGKEYVVEGVEEDDGISVKFGDQWFRSVDDFFGKALIDGELLLVMYTELIGFRVK